MNTQKTFLFLIFCILNIGAKNCYAQGNSLVINEIMQSNVNSLFVDYDFPDSWVELYNPTDNEINIKKMRIGLSEDVAESYTITVDSIIASSIATRLATGCTLISVLTPGKEWCVCLTRKER